MASTRINTNFVPDSHILLDSGASKHILCDRKYFWDMSNEDQQR